MRIGLLISGGLGLKLLNELSKQYTVLIVLTDKSSIGITDFCASNHIANFVGNPRNKKAAHLIQNYEIDALISVNYLFLIERDLINWPKLYAVNFHGSLLPRYRGRTPHVWAIINNEKETGITAHLIDEGCDTGPIIDQIKVPIGEEDTGALILEEYITLYPAFVKQVIERIQINQVKMVEQEHWKATYYSKRTPDDGQIDWNWQKERIRNWVRAQAHPYPGAFTFYKGEKVVVNKITFSEQGYTDSAVNGTILATEDERPIVKTQNGAIKFMDYSSENKVFQRGERFV